MTQWLAGQDEFDRTMLKGFSNMEMIIAVAALFSALAALIAVYASLRIASKNRRAESVRERLQRIRDELSRFCGNASFLMADHSLLQRSPELFAERLQALFLQRAAVAISLNSEDEDEARLNSALGEALQKLESAVGVDRRESAVDEVSELINRAAREFHLVRAKEEKRL